MTDIQPNARGQLRRARKRLRRHAVRLRMFNQLTPAQQEQLLLAVVQDLIQLQTGGEA